MAKKLPASMRTCEELSVLIVGRLSSLVGRSRLAELATRLNGRPMRCLGVSRKDLFEAIERPALRPLPVESYEFAIWQFARLG